MINEFLVTDISYIVFPSAFQKLVKHTDSFFISSVKEIGWFYAIHECDSIIILDVWKMEIGRMKNVNRNHWRSVKDTFCSLIRLLIFINHDKVYFINIPPSLSKSINLWQTICSDLVVEIESITDTLKILDHH